MQRRGVGIRTIWTFAGKLAIRPARAFQTRSNLIFSSCFPTPYLVFVIRTREMTARNQAEEIAAGSRMGGIRIA
jgi:hypothetical protein